ncbi:chitinase [Microdochium nivale]|nr:chitinase [Microdochium nivale]
MASSRVLPLALWVVAALLVVHCLAADTFHGHKAHPRNMRRPQHTLSQPAAILHARDGDVVTGSSAADFTPNPHAVHRSLVERDGGPLYCTNGPCVDGSCCGKNNICGYGPDYCGTGCQSQCNATAMCGEFSENGEFPCGMNLCCSATGWCDTTAVYCDNADPLHGTLPCQAGYGSCQTYPTPSCPAGGGSTNGRSVGYYQSWNMRERKCDSVSPKQLDTSLYTHLFYAFASINPSTFAITNAHPDDEKNIPEFTALKKNGGPQTWIAVGGFDFSDPGVDLYWEYPGATERGGNKLADVRNFPMLLREMRAAFGTSYGISLTLAPDYWYARWFDAKAMEPYVDFFGFMAYDLHGSWDQDVKTLTKTVRGQANIREISTDTTPLWFDGLDPAKINFGLAMYGRGYTVADPSCNTLLCEFTGPSKPGPCTGFNGVMSLLEIKKLIKEKGYTSRYLPDSMMKELTYEDQWIGYDDEETFAAKKAWADSRCFGGTMVWGIDYGVGAIGDSGENVIYLGTPVYSGIPAQCTPPCQFVLPPLSLATPTTISISPYTTSLEVVVGITTTITVTINAITTIAMNFYNVNVTDSAGYTITPAASIDLEPVITTLTISGSTQVRTLILPPWPAITQGPPGNWTSTSDSADDVPWPTTFPNPPNTGGPIIITSVSKTAFTPPAGWEDGDATPTTNSWPIFTLEPVETDVPESGEDDNCEGPSSKSTCKLWFFWVCVDWIDLDIHIHGWKWTIPPGKWGPGPPNLLNFKLPPGFEIKGTLPRWPRLTIPTAGPFPTPAKPADCTPAKASLCYTTSSFGTTVTGGSTKTTATQTTSRCATITSCNFQDVEATVTRGACSLGWGARGVAIPTATAAAAGDLQFPRR